MKDFRERFLDRAFKIVPGVVYNQARKELIEKADIVPVIYEIIFPEKGGWEEFRDKTMPLMMKYLKSQGIDPELPKLLVVSIFYKDKAYFLEGQEFMNVLCEIEGLNSQGFHFRVLRWLTE